MEKQCSKRKQTKPLSSRDRTLVAISEYWRDNGFSPSIRDIGSMTGIPSTSQTAYYLGRLEQLGYIRRAKGAARAITITSEGSRLLDEMLGHKKPTDWGVKWPDEPGYWWCCDGEDCSVWLALDDMTVTDGAFSYTSKSYEFTSTRWEKVAMPSVLVRQATE